MVHGVDATRRQVQCSAVSALALQGQKREKETGRGRQVPDSGWQWQWRRAKEPNEVCLQVQITCNTTTSTPRPGHHQRLETPRALSPEDSKRYLTCLLSSRVMRWCLRLGRQIFWSILTDSVLQDTRYAASVAPDAAPVATWHPDLQSGMDIQPSDGWDTHARLRHSPRWNHGTLPALPALPADSVNHPAAPPPDFRPSPDTKRQDKTTAGSLLPLWESPVSIYSIPDTSDRALV